MCLVIVNLNERLLKNILFSPICHNQHFSKLHLYSPIRRWMTPGAPHASVGRASAFVVMVAHFTTHRYSRLMKYDGCRGGGWPSSCCRSWVGGGYLSESELDGSRRYHTAGEPTLKGRMVHKLWVTARCPPTAGSCWVCRLLRRIQVCETHLHVSMEKNIEGAVNKHR